MQKYVCINRKRERERERERERHIYMCIYIYVYMFGSMLGSQGPSVANHHFSGNPVCIGSAFFLRPPKFVQRPLSCAQKTKPHLDPPM